MEIVVVDFARTIRVALGLVFLSLELTALVLIVTSVFALLTSWFEPVSKLACFFNFFRVGRHSGIYELLNDRQSGNRECVFASFWLSSRIIDSLLFRWFEDQSLNFMFLFTLIGYFLDLFLSFRSSVPEGWPIGCIGSKLAFFCGMVCLPICPTV